MFSLGANLWLSHRLRSAERAILKSSRLSPGELVPVFDAKLENGQTIHLGWEGRRKTLLYYFDPDCLWCMRNAEAFGTLIGQLGASIEVYSYTSSLRGVEEFKRQARHTAKVLTDDREDLRRLLRLRGTPQTLVIDANGRVLKNWEGVYRGSNRVEIQEYFHVRIAAVVD